MVLVAADPDWKLLPCDIGQFWGRYKRTCFRKTPSLLVLQKRRVSNLSSPRGVSAQAVITWPEGLGGRHPCRTHGHLLRHGALSTSSETSEVAAKPSSPANNRWGQQASHWPNHVTPKNRRSLRDGLGKNPEESFPPPPCPDWFIRENTAVSTKNILIKMYTGLLMKKKKRKTEGKSFLRGLSVKCSRGAGKLWWSWCQNAQTRPPARLATHWMY